MIDTIERVGPVVYDDGLYYRYEYESDGTMSPWWPVTTMSAHSVRISRSRTAANRQIRYWDKTLGQGYLRDKRKYEVAWGFSINGNPNPFANEDGSTLIQTGYARGGKA